ncbi:MAG: type I-C CRISPR-associated protein Cas8c/Csd1 [Thiobacillus sp.]
MILQALKEYYDRKAADPDAGIAPPGFEWKEIPFVIILDGEGNLVQIEDTRTGDAKKKRAKSFLVPQGEKRTSGVNSYRLWDNAEYIFGLEDEQKKQNAFIAKLDEYLVLEDDGLNAMKLFLTNQPDERAKGRAEWKEIVETKPWLAFRMVGEDELICQHPKVIGAIKAEVEQTNNRKPMVCLITGNPAPATRLQPPIKGVRDANTTGADIVSFNLRAFESYGKEERQGENAPISEAGSFAYTTALNHLLRKDSTQKMQIGDASTVFWADAPDELETGFLDLFGEPRKDDPDSNVKAVESLYRSAETGSFATDRDATRFFVLGLAPNAARVSIRFWQTGTVAEFAERIRQHFDDLKINRTPFDPPYLSLFRLLINSAKLGEAKNIPPNLAGEFMRAVLSGLPYPQTLLQATIRQIRAEQAKKNDKTGKSLPNVPYARAALIKACLNRASRLKNQQEDITVSLDTTNPNPAYRLGRLFAVLEKIQEAANPGLNTTIRDRFYGAASSSPVTVFPTLLKLKIHHLAKLSVGHKVYYEKMIGEIVSELREFPAQLPLPEQGRFAIGYYHQQRDLYTKK